jgi:hypothetical protein
VTRIRTLTGFPDVLLVSGSELRHDSYRSDLRSVLYSADSSTSTVRRGTHHFWITWFVPTTDGGEFDDGDADARPARLRGVIRMGRTPGDTDPDTMQAQLRTMLEEIGHHWLVPADLDFGSGVLDRLATRDEFTAYLNEGAPLRGVPLLGRDNLHWNSYLQADKSPMDGQWWTEEQKEGPLTRWTNRKRDVATLTLPSFDPVILSTAYSDLDLAIMGLVDPRAVYPETDNALQWIDPQRVAPLPYRAGVCVCESNTSVLVFGFEQDHRTLGVVRIDSSGVRVLATVTPARFPGPPFGVALRVVRRGDVLHFQARADESVGAHLAPEPRDIPGGAATAARIRDGFTGLGSIPGAGSPADLAEFRTIASVPSPKAPVAVGALVERRDRSVFASAGFFNFEVRDETGGRETVHSFANVPSALSGSFDTAGARPRLHRGGDGAIVARRGRSVLVVTAPYAKRSGDTFTLIDSLALDIGADHAPKVLLEPPGGDFAFVTSMAMIRTATLPWAAGYLRDRQVWGRVHRVPVGALRFTAAEKDKQLRVGRSSLHRYAFIIVAASDADLNPERELVERVDLLRRYFELAMPRASRGLLRATTKIDP